MAIVRFDPFRSSREFDRLANQFLGLATSDDRDTSFAPAYDLEQHGEDTYFIHMALPGVSEDSVELTVQDGFLTVASKAVAPENSDNVRALYRGIGRGKFERRFKLAEHVEVNEARLVQGILSIKLVRVVPEALKPRTIQIATSEAPVVGNNSVANDRAAQPASQNVAIEAA